MPEMVAHVREVRVHALDALLQRRLLLWLECLVVQPHRLRVLLAVGSCCLLALDAVSLLLLLAAAPLGFGPALLLDLLEILECDVE